jgi:hypothetical protein
VRRFTELHRERCELLWGGCEALFTPRPLGPLADMADALPSALGARIQQGHTYNGLYPAFLTFLRDREKPLLLVLEDVHWADGATLDLIKYLARRVRATQALLILTYRDDELSLDHPLRKVLGELPADSAHRLALPLLSEDAVSNWRSTPAARPEDCFGLPTATLSSSPRRSKAAPAKRRPRCATRCWRGSRD